MKTKKVYPSVDFENLTADPRILDCFIGCLCSFEPRNGDVINEFFDIIFKHGLTGLEPLRFTGWGSGRFRRNGVYTYCMNVRYFLNFIANSDVFNSKRLASFSKSMDKNICKMSLLSIFDYHCSTTEQMINAFCYTDVDMVSVVLSNLHTLDTSDYEITSYYMDILNRYIEHDSL